MRVAVTIPVASVCWALPVWPQQQQSMGTFYSILHHVTSCRASWRREHSRLLLWPSLLISLPLHSVCLHKSSFLFPFQQSYFILLHQWQVPDRCPGCVLEGLTGSILWVVGACCLCPLLCDGCCVHWCCLSQGLENEEALPFVLVMVVKVLSCIKRTEWTRKDDKQYLSYTFF